MIKSLLKKINLALQKQIQDPLNELLKSIGFDKEGNGAFNLPSQDVIDRFKEGVKDAGDGVKKAFDILKEVFQEGDIAQDGLKGAIKGMSEQTADVLAGQFNAIRINTGEILKMLKQQQEHSLDIARLGLLHLAKIEGNTRNLIQMKKDLSDINSKLKSSNELRPFWL